MDLYCQTKEAWENSENLRRQSGEWVKRILNAQKEFSKARRLFREPRGLRVYLSIDRINERTPSFSLRFAGQEVGEVKVRGGKVALRVSGDHADSTKKYFKLEAPAGGPWPWSGSREAVAFRKAFATLSSCEPRVVEHRYESRIIREMKRDDRAKFGSRLSGIQPVLLANCPFQCPLPIAASSGLPLDARGSIDILARRLTDHHRTILSVWEVKRPGVLASGPKQAYIYAVTLVLLLRSEHGHEWYKAFGFQGPIPDHVEVEAVTCVSGDRKGDAVRQMRQLHPVELEVENAKICLAVASYDPKMIDQESFPVALNQDLTSYIG